MARKKSGGTATEIDEGPVDFTKESKSAALIKKTFGTEVVKTGQDVMELEREVISSGSPALDSALGGGFMTGTCVTIAGRPGCGKTSTVMATAAEWQALGRRVFYLSAEGRFYKMNLEGVQGLDPSKIEVVQHARGAILTAEKFLGAAEMIIKNEYQALVIIDSLSVLHTNAEAELPDYEKAAPVGGSVRLVSQWCKKVTPIVPLNHNLVIGIAHVYTNIGGKGKKYATSLATKAEYFRSTGIECGWTEFLQKDGDKTAWGQRIHWTVERSSLGPPKGKAESILRYGYGIDKEFEIIEQSMDLGLVSQSGAYYYMDFLGGEPTGLQGMDKACKYLRENPEPYGLLKKQIRDLITPAKED